MKKRYHRQKKDGTLKNPIMYKDEKNPPLTDMYYNAAFQSPPSNPCTTGYHIYDAAYQSPPSDPYSTAYPSPSSDMFYDAAYQSPPSDPYSTAYPSPPPDMYYDAYPSPPSDPCSDVYYDARQSPVPDLHQDQRHVPPSDPYYYGRYGYGNAPSTHPLLPREYYSPHKNVSTQPTHASSPNEHQYNDLQTPPPLARMSSGESSRATTPSECNYGHDPVDPFDEDGSVGGGNAEVPDSGNHDDVMKSVEDKPDDMSATATSTIRKITTEVPDSGNHDDVMKSAEDIPDDTSMTATSTIRKRTRGFTGVLHYLIIQNCCPKKMEGKSHPLAAHQKRALKDQHRDVLDDIDLLSHQYNVAMGTKRTVYTCDGLHVKPHLGANSEDKNFYDKEHCRRKYPKCHPKC